MRTACVCASIPRSLLRTHTPAFSCLPLLRYNRAQFIISIPHCPHSPLLCCRIALRASVYYTPRPALVYIRVWFIQTLGLRTAFPFLPSAPHTPYFTFSLHAAGFTCWFTVIRAFYRVAYRTLRARCYIGSALRFTTYALPAHATPNVPFGPAPPSPTRHATTARGSVAVCAVPLFGAAIFTPPRTHFVPLCLRT